MRAPLSKPRRWSMDQPLRYEHLATPIVNLLLYGMGGREGAQSEAELIQIAEAPTGLCSADRLQTADAYLATLELNPSQRAAASACLQRRLTLVDVILSMRRLDG